MAQEGNITVLPASESIPWNDDGESIMCLDARCHRSRDTPINRLGATDCISRMIPWAKRCRDSRPFSVRSVRLLCLSSRLSEEYRLTMKMLRYWKSWGKELTRFVIWGL